MSDTPAVALPIADPEPRARAVAPERRDGPILQNGLVVSAEAFVLPAFHDLAVASEGLRRAVLAHCDGYGPLEDAQARFADVFLAWQRASVIQIGPIAQGNGPMQMQLWPDPKGFTRRALAFALKEGDPALLRPDGLQGRSVALVSLTAVERMLFGDLLPRSDACDLTVAIVSRKAEHAQRLSAAWETGSAFRTAYDTAREGNATYPNVDALVREMLAGVVVYADRLRKFKLERPLGQDTGDARPARSEARLSGLGLASIATGFATLRALYDVPGGFFDVTPEAGGTMEYFTLAETAGSVADALRFEPQSLEEILAEDSPRAAALRRFAELTLFHEAYLKEGLPRALGLTAGFTSADGD